MARLFGFRTELIALLTFPILVCVGGTANADFVFGPATNIGAPVNGPQGAAEPAISADGLTLYFNTYVNNSPRDIWFATRETTDDTWGEPMRLGWSVNHSASWDRCASISEDGLSLYFDSSRPNGTNNFPHIYVSTRATQDDPWGPAENLGPSVNRGSGHPCISADGLSLYFASDRAGALGGADIYVTTRPSLADPWETATNLGAPINSAARDRHPDLSSDGRVLFFERSGDIWMAMRETESSDWGDPIRLGPEVNSTTSESGPCVTSDGSMLYFSAMSEPGNLGEADIWQAPIIPVVDFNADGWVDSFEVLALAERWGTDDFLCDIGPKPWGDGVVDVEDLKVLAKYIGQDVVDASLIAHWTLNETEGDVAYDNSFEYDAVVQGGAAWQPEAGIIDGALALDGVDDYVETPHIAALKQGSFSIFAWVKGGGADQVIISAATGSNWLLGSTAGRTGVGGKLATMFGGTTLTSESMIADDQWHRLGLVYDGEKRTLYVDDIAVAEDGATDTRPASFRLNIGCGADQGPGTFFSGLIDDVRIYNRVVRP